MNLRIWVIAAAMTFPALHASGQAASTPSAPAAASAQPTSVASSTPASAVPAAAVPAIQDRLTKIEEGIAKVESKQSPWMSLVAVVIGALISGVVAWLGQKRLLSHQEKMADKGFGKADEQADKRFKADGDLAEKKAQLDGKLAVKKAELDAAQTTYRLRVQQLTELYGPLRALLEQSNAVYRFMNDVLIESDTKKYRYDPAPSAQYADRKAFQVFESGQWLPFKTVLYLDRVYGGDLGVDHYFDSIVEIGARISKIVAEKAGLVLVRQSDLREAFGKYLAHYEVLAQLHKRALSLKVRTADSPPVASPSMAVRISAAFPSDIQELVKAGHEELLRELARGPEATGNT